MTGGGFFSMPGLIILDTIDHDKIVNSIKYLYEIGYFNWFAGSDNMRHEKQFMSEWYETQMSPYVKSKLVSLVIHLDK